MRGVFTGAPWQRADGPHDRRIAAAIAGAGFPRTGEVLNQWMNDASAPV